MGKHDLSDRNTDARLAALEQRIAHWRLTRTKHSPMPKPLWDEAVALAQLLGIAPVARRLGLGYASLQQRLPSPPLPKPTFVELQPALPPPATSSGVVVEVIEPDGARLTLRLPPGAPLDLASVLRAFAGRRS